jgi:hypothetical protein
MCNISTEKEDNTSVRKDETDSKKHNNNDDVGFFEDFGWSSSSTVLRRMQQKLREHVPTFSTNEHCDGNNTEPSASEQAKQAAAKVVKSKAKEALAAISAEEEATLREQQEKIIWRDFTFMVIALGLGSIMSFVEMNIADVEIRGGGPEDESRGGILDAGFILTKPLHDYLEQNRGVNDLLAAINSLIGVMGPFAYMAYQTAWVGDFDPIFRYLTISAIRSLCGWVTFLPPDRSYLMSHYDFPDLAHCLIKDCGDPQYAQIQPFVTFFSGHVGKCNKKTV